MADTDGRRWDSSSRFRPEAPAAPPLSGRVPQHGCRVLYPHLTDLVRSWATTASPRQSKVFATGMGRYHDKVTGKNDKHEAFRAKAAALRDPATPGQQDW
jgi:hypothetical protein